MLIYSYIFTLKGGICMKFSKIYEIIKENKIDLSDKKRILNELFPQFNYHELEMDHSSIDIHEDTNDTKDVVSLHSHSFYEILLCKSGNLQYLIGDTRYQLQKNDLVFLPPGISHCPILTDHIKDPYRRIVLWVNSDFQSELNTIIKETCKDNDFSISHMPNIIRLSGTLFYYVDNLIEQLLLERNNCLPGNELSCIGLYIQLFAFLYRTSCTYSTIAPKPEKKELLDNIISYIENNLSEDISLKSISSHFLVSQSSISQLFKKQLDLSFYRVVTQRRLIEAKNLIFEGIPLKEIPERCGFSDYSVFYKAFIKEYGISPRQFRQYETHKISLE